MPQTAGGRRWPTQPRPRGAGASERSVAELVKQLSDQTSRLARQEVALAKAELELKGKAKRRIEETKTTLGEKKQELRGKAEHASPEVAVSAASRAAGWARENSLPIAAAAAFAAGFLVGRLTSR